MLDFQTTLSATPVKYVTGQWCAVRMCLDLATQEWLNVGVLFRGDDGIRQFRLIESLAGIRCMYDEDAASSAHFLLDQASFALEERHPIPAGWNISLGPEKFVRGKSAQSIVDSLFVRLVPLGRHHVDVARTDREDHPHATQNVRVTVRKLLNRHLQLAKNGTPDFWRRTPIPAQRDGSIIHMDVQIEAATKVGSLYGAIASSWYKTKYHRTASLSQAVNAMSTAREAFPDGHSVLYLLRPPSDEKSLSAEDHQAISEDIETSQWLLRKHDAGLCIARSEAEMAFAILSDLNLVPEMQ